MCIQIQNRDTGEKTDKPFMFAGMIGMAMKDLPVNNRFNTLLPDDCLCQVDCKKACELTGFEYLENDEHERSAIIFKKSYSKNLSNIARHR